MENQEKKNKVSEVVAAADFQRFLDGCDGDTDGMNEEELSTFSQLQRRIERAIRRGTCVIDADGLPTVTPVFSKNKEPLVFSRPKGSVFIQKSKNDTVRNYDVMAEMTETDRETFEKMDVRDLNVCLALTKIFLA